MCLEWDQKLSWLDLNVKIIKICFAYGLPKEITTAVKLCAFSKPQVSFQVSYTLVRGTQKYSFTGFRGLLLLVFSPCLYEHFEVTIMNYVLSSAATSLSAEYSRCKN